MQEWDREWPGALLARRTRTMKLCTSHARSRGQPWPLPSRCVREAKREHPSLASGRVKREREGGLAIPCARATRGLRRPSLDARTLGKRQAVPPILRGRREKRTGNGGFNKALLPAQAGRLYLDKKEKHKRTAKPTMREPCTRFVISLLCECRWIHKVGMDQWALKK